MGHLFIVERPWTFVALDRQYLAYYFLRDKALELSVSHGILLVRHHRARLGGVVLTGCSNSPLSYFQCSSSATIMDFNPVELRSASHAFRDTKHSESV